MSQRLRHMDELGIGVQVLYNSLWLMALTNRPDAEIALSWVWNRWLARFARLVKIACAGPVRGAVEIRFAKNHGAVGVCMRPFERDRMMTDPLYYPIYDEAQRLDLPIAFHLANGSPELFKLMTNEAGGGFFVFRVPTVTACYALTMSELPRAFPKLRRGLSKCRASGFPG